MLRSLQTSKRRNPLHRDDAIADLMFLERALEERFAYLTANAVDHSALRSL